ncbi:MAG TPA: hypothetical protein VJK02_17325 [Anaerolineales bacterium]|nr:hypothetical protein [Anaerolineales bacterium]
MKHFVDTSGVTWMVNDLAGYVRFRRQRWEPERFRSILTAPDGLRRRFSRRIFAKAQDAIVYRSRVRERLARMQAQKRLDVQ